jgi:hypothetical protein
MGRVYASGMGPGLGIDIDIDDHRSRSIRWSPSPLADVEVSPRNKEPKFEIAIVKKMRRGGCALSLSRGHVGRLVLVHITRLRALTSFASVFIAF